MRRAEIREAVEIKLAALGYRPGYYGWCKPGWLEIWDGKMRRDTYNLPAVRKMTPGLLDSILNSIPKVGRPRPANVRMAGYKGDGWKQLDLVDAIRDAR